MASGVGGSAKIKVGDFSHFPKAKIKSKHELLIQGDLSEPQPDSIRVALEQDADIPLTITNLKKINEHSNEYLITVQESLSASDHVIITSKTENLGWYAAPSLTATLITVIIGSALINNFVFSRYLGLCVFFGVSKKKDTAIGMGVTFTIIGLLSGFLCWALHQFTLAPLNLDFLQIIAFIGIVASLVQAADTILKKIQPVLHRKFGIYLVLITSNCIILAIPLLNASNDASFSEAMALALGSSLGFALALFLMSCARERIELAPIPKVFQGLPIAFIVAGLFALSFLGFSGLKFM